MSATVGVDPRIRARRIAVRRAAGRRRLKVLAAATGALFVLVGGYGLSRSPLLDVDAVEVSGVEGPRAAVVVAASGVEISSPLIDVDPAGVRAAVQSLPWVRRVEVSRRWPGRLRLEVEPREPVALVPTTTGAALVDDEGIVTGFEPRLDRLGLPRIEIQARVELGEPVPGLAPALAFLEAAPADLEPWVQALVVSGGSVEFRLAGGIRALLGRGDHVADKVTALRTVLGRVELSCVSTIDVRVADLVTVRRDPACDPLTAAALVSGSAGGAGDA